MTIDKETNDNDLFIYSRNIMKYMPIFILLCLPLILTHCAATERTPREAMIMDESEVDFSQYRDLAECLRDMPGLQVRGAGRNTSIRIRRMMTSDTDSGPLYVVDGRDRGYSFSDIYRFVNMSDVSRIEVLTGSDADAYGIRGSGGVIVISRNR